MQSDCSFIMMSVFWPGHGELIGWWWLSVGSQHCIVRGRASEHLGRIVINARALSLPFRNMGNIMWTRICLWL